MCRFVHRTLQGAISAAHCAVSPSKAVTFQQSGNARKAVPRRIDKLMRLGFVPAQCAALTAPYESHA
jgi:hypothetical protein